MMQSWLDRLHSSRPPKPTDVLTACTKHRDEQEVIPQGLSKGWPGTINFEDLRQKISDPENSYLEKMSEIVKNPKSSVWFDEVLEVRARLGRKALTSGMSMESMEEEQAG